MLVELYSLLKESLVRTQSVPFLFLSAPSPSLHSLNVRLSLTPFIKGPSAIEPLRFLQDASEILNSSFLVLRYCARERVCPVNVLFYQLSAPDFGCSSSSSSDTACDFFWRVLIGPDAPELSLVDVLRALLFLGS